MTTMLFAAQYKHEMQACGTYHFASTAADEDVPSLDDLLAEVNAAFKSSPCYEFERPTTASTNCSFESGWSRCTSDESTTTTSSTSQVMKVDWNFPGSLDGEESVTLARSLKPQDQSSSGAEDSGPTMHSANACMPRKQPVHSYCPPPRGTSKCVTAVCVTPEMINVQGVFTTTHKGMVQQG